tara:strand:- start:788 stop:1084 length:297 start_codon:yes stop_codon:yes gene_type:complete
MAFSKRFPKTVEGSTYPIWEEITLTEEEEKEVEQKCREENLSLMKKCISDAKETLAETELNEKFQTNVIRLATSLFEKRASHVAFFKESKCKEKFDNK